MIICLLYSNGMQCKKRYDQGLSMRKNIPYGLLYGSFFLYPEFHGLKIFYTVLHMTNMDNFLYINYEKKTEKIND